MPRVALITGAARGIGRAIAEDLARDHDIAFTFHEGAEAASALCRAVPAALAIRADLLDPAAPGRIVAETVSRFGRIDLLVNNAGLIAETPVEAEAFALHRRMFEVNATAPMALLSAALPHMGAGAAVVNISSINASFPPASAGAYAASKAALEAATRAAAKALGPRGIRVNAVAPGLIERAEKPRPAAFMAEVIADTPLRRAGRPDDIAGAVRFLASEAAGFITGEVLRVDGGLKL